MPERGHFLDKLENFLSRSGLLESLSEAAVARLNATNRALGVQALDACPPCIDGDELIAEQLAKE